MMSSASLQRWISHVRVRPSYKTNVINKLVARSSSMFTHVSYARGYKKLL